MGIFFQGRTTCAICDRAIDERAEAVQIPYIRPDDVLSPALWTRPFVHRACWNTWDQREAISASAFALLKASAGDAEVRDLLYAEHGLVVESWRTGVVRIHDLRTLVVLDLPSEQLTTFRGLLSHATVNALAPTLVGGTSIRVSCPRPADSVSMTVLTNDGETIWSAELSPARRDEWLRALDAANV